MANFSPKHFSALFHQRVGVTFSVWRHAVSIENARRLLLNEGALVETVGPAVGYENLDSFTRAFKRREGVCPREFRSTVRKYPELKLLFGASSAWTAAEIFRLHAMQRTSGEIVSLLCRLASLLSSQRFD